MIIDWRTRKALLQMSATTFDDYHIPGVGKGTYKEMVKRGWAEAGVSNGKAGYRLTAEGKRIRDNL